MNNYALIEDLSRVGKARTSEINMNELIISTQKEIQSQIITQFGLSQIFDSFQTGGDVTTLRNAQKGIFANVSDEERFNKEFNRKDYEGRVDPETGKDTRMNTLRKEKFNQQEILVDDYSDKVLKKDGSTHLDHIKSAKEIHSDDAARLYMSDDQRNDLALSEENIAFTDSRINQSKGKKDLKEWSEESRRSGETNAEHFETNTEKVDEKHKLANESYDKSIKKAKRDYYVSNTVNESAKTGFNQAKKQAIGTVIIEINTIFFGSIGSLFNSWNMFTNAKERFNYFIESIKSKLNGMKQRLVDIFITIKNSAVAGFTGGVLSSVTNTLINTVIKTSARFAKLLNDTVTSVIRAIKLLTQKSTNIPKEVRYKEAVKIISTAIATSIGVMLTESLSTYLKTTVLNPLAVEISTLIGSILTGVLVSLTVFLVDNFSEILAKIKDSFNNFITTSKTTAEEIKQSYKESLKNIEHVYSELMARIEEEYLVMLLKQSQAFNTKLPPIEQFHFSVEYADYLGVKRQVTNLEEIDDFFIK